MLDHLADLESDFSRFHRIDDMLALDGPRFFRLAWRIAAYDGMLARRIEAQNHKPDVSPRRTDAGSSQSEPRQERTPAAGPGRMPLSSKYRNARVVPLAALAANAPGVIERVVAAPAPPAEPLPE